MDPGADLSASWRVARKSFGPSCARCGVAKLGGPLSVMPSESRTTASLLGEPGLSFLGSDPLSFKGRFRDSIDGGVLSASSFKPEGCAEKEERKPKKHGYEIPGYLQRTPRHSELGDRVFEAGSLPSTSTMPARLAPLRLSELARRIGQSAIAQPWLGKS